MVRFRLSRRRVFLNLHRGRHACSRSMVSVPQRPPLLSHFSLLLPCVLSYSLVCSNFLLPPAIFSSYRSSTLLCSLARRSLCRTSYSYFCPAIRSPNLVSMPRERQNIVQLAKERDSDKGSSIVNGDQLLPTLEDGTLRNLQAASCAWEEYVWISVLTT